ncbi:prepilin-type N-terminal cleavage/methylation domain-containing protein [Porticoccaceae bacterium]|nr:prepilin-type N-terminal cleavage/methylation domain-containing protein [Porticoccaceae bacterium]MDB9843458.1 prepilin-type N-terminal cleavage/methylation domain-containing protein [Porticoccaceae bacterium]|tara:strand:+ start:433 stop:846 length:414 start_codon:yes stop_codon:yes gene_type:complete
MNRGTQKLAQGFTLVEVLVSGFILFLVLAAMTDLYRGAILGSSKAEQSLKISSAVSFVRANLSASLRANPPLQEGKGNGKFGEVYYKWNARRVSVGSAPIALQEDLAREVRYTLWRVELKFEYMGSIRRFHFSEVTW